MLRASQVSTWKPACAKWWANAVQKLRRTAGRVDHHVALEAVDVRGSGPGAGQTACVGTLNIHSDAAWSEKHRHAKVWCSLHSQVFFMLITQLESRSGLSRDAIRHCERRGLIAPPRRAENGYRLYEAHTLQELSFIAKAQEIGFTLQQIKPAIKHLRGPPGECPELVDSLAEKGREIERRIEQDMHRLDQLKN
jgi:MerR family copper efflux transcriptional regulator